MTSLVDEQALYNPTTVDELNQITGVNTPYITYSDLQHCENIEDIVNDASPCIYILLDFERSGNSITGHWTTLCLFNELDENSGEAEYSLSYFDSFGKKVDGEMYMIPKSYIKQYYSAKDILTKLVKKSAYGAYNVKYIDYNTHKYQSADTATCGRYCAAFIKLAIERASAEVYDTEVFYDFISGIKQELIEDGKTGSGPNGKVLYDDVIVALTL